MQFTQYNFLQRFLSLQNYFIYGLVYWYTYLFLFSISRYKFYKKKEHILLVYTYTPYTK
jgi:hypothetical protein